MKYILIVLVFIIVIKRAKHISEGIKEKKVKKVFFEVVFLLILFSFTYLLYWLNSNLVD